MSKWNWTLTEVPAETKPVLVNKYQKSLNIDLLTLNDSSSIK